jgi:hypothetical protein
MALWCPNIARPACATLRRGNLRFPLARRAKIGGADRIRTCDPHNAIVVLYQLSYDPIHEPGQSKDPGQNVKTFFVRWNRQPRMVGVCEDG